MKTMRNTWRLQVFVFLAISFPLSSSAQITFERTYGGSSDDRGLSVQQTSDGGFIISGASQVSFFYFVTFRVRGLGT